MSHFTRTNTKLVEKRYLIQALRELGYRPQEGSLRVRGWGGNASRADICITPKESNHDIGFRKAGKAYICVADWLGVPGMSQESFLQSLTQRYARAAVQDQLSAQGFAVAEEKTVQGRIHLLLRRSG